MLVLKVTFRGNSLKEFAQHYLTDLGQTGMFVRTRSPLPVGTKLRFEFRLENDIPLLVGQGIVLWVSEENRELQIPCGMELRFDSLSPESENHFQWLQLEKRGVTVGTEVPLYIATSTTASDPTGTAGKDSSDPDPGRITPARGARALGNRTLQGIKAPPDESSRSPRPPTGPLPVVSHLERAPTGPERAIPHLERAPTGPERAIPHLERAPTGPERAIPHLERAPTGPERAIAETSPALAEDGRATLPYLRGPEAEERSRLPVLARRGANEGLKGYRPSAPLGPGDSDPGKMFSQVAPREASQTGRRLDGVVGRDTLLTIHELAGRRLRLGGVVLVGVGLIALAVWWLARTPAPSLAEQGQSSALRLVRITSVPVGAEVVLEGRSAGRTPLELPTGGEPMLQLQHEGYQTEVVTVSRLDPRWRTEGGRQVLELKVTLARAAAGAPDARPEHPAARAIDAAPEPRRRRPLPEAKKPEPARKPELEVKKPEVKKPEPETKKPEPETKKPEPETKKPELETKKPEPETKKPEPETKKPEPELKKPAVKTPDWASKPEARPEKQEKKVKQPGWAD